jgi:hypothetical protein
MHKPSRNYRTPTPDSPLSPVPVPLVKGGSSIAELGCKKAKTNPRAQPQLQNPHPPPLTRPSHLCLCRSSKAVAPL